jgi:hypothetical protein
VCLTKEQQNELVEKFKNFDFKNDTTEVDPIMQSVANEFFKELNLSESDIPPNRVPDSLTRVPQTVLNAHSIPPLKNSGIVIYLAKNFIEENTRRSFPTFLNIFNRTIVPINKALGSLLIQRMKLNMNPSYLNQIKIDFVPQSNSLDFTLENAKIKMDLDLKLFFLIGDLEANLQLELILKKVKVRTIFTRDFKRYYFKPQVVVEVLELDIDYSEIKIVKNNSSIPLFVVSLIQKFFKKEIEFALTNLLYKQVNGIATLKTNAFIQKYYPDNVEFLPNLFSFNTLNTNKIMLSSNSMIVSLFGDYIDLQQEYQISEEEETTILNFAPPNQGIKIYTTERIIAKAISKVLSLRQFSRVEKNILGKNIIFKINFPSVEFKFLNELIVVENVSFGSMCSSDDEFNCSLEMSVSVSFKLVSVDLVNGVLNIGNVFFTRNGKIGESFAKNGIMDHVIDAVIAAMVPNVINFSPLPLPDFVNISPLEFTQYNGFILMQGDIYNRVLI